MLDPLIDYLAAFSGALVLTLLLTPIVRELNRRLGMVDLPGTRRINKVPIPRGGGVALFLGVIASYALFLQLTGRPALQGVSDAVFWKLTLLAAVLVGVGLIDDRFSLPPLVKLVCQIAVAALVWWWADLGFGDIWPDLPVWLDCLITVFWIIGAVNAFNLIDGLDGLASGLALIATFGMAGALFFCGNAQQTLFYLAFMGGLLGFLRYNYNPASVFLGDSGSMYIGFTVAVLPLCSHATNSFLVSVGVPLLAMGVPVFDAALAILRRSIRRMLYRGTAEGGVMVADTDHLHHRVLRAVGFSQRKAAWVLYVIAAFFVLVGIVGVVLKSRTAGLWLVALTVATFVAVRELARVEFFDFGRLLGSVARSPDAPIHRRLTRLATPLYILFDVSALTAMYAVTYCLLIGTTRQPFFFETLLVRVSFVFICLVALRAYRTVWSRALAPNYARLVAACLLGAVGGAAVICLSPAFPDGPILSFTFLYALLSVFSLVFVRLFRSLIRDAFYAADCSRLVARKDVSRVLVYGGGLRYRFFRRELVRTTAANERIIVGILDDDILLHGKYIGGIQVLGSIQDAPALINRVNADAVVIACEQTAEQAARVKALLAPTGVSVSLFALSERPL